MSKTDTIFPKLKYCCDNTTAFGLIFTFTIPGGKIVHLMAEFQRFCGWCEEFVITVYWHVCVMAVLGDHNSEFDALVCMISALVIRISGTNGDLETVDAVPITLMSLAESERGVSSLICTSETAHCGGCCSAPMCEHIGVMVNARSNSLFSPEDSGDTCNAIDEMGEARILSVGHI